MPEMRKPKAYLTYVNDEVTRGLLLDEVVARGSVLKIGGKTFSSKRPIPKILIEDMESNFGVVTSEICHMEYGGKRKIFGIPGTSSMTLPVSGEKHIRVRILAETPEEIYIKISQLKQKLAEYGIKEKMCVWDRLGKITVDYEKPKKKVKTDFDPKQVKNQRRLELETLRQH